MKNFFKKLLSLTLVTLMLIPLIANMGIISFAAATSGTCGDDLTWVYNNGTLTIMGTGAMKNYTSSSHAPWYSYRNSITNVVIGNYVTSIGNYAFYYCTTMKSVTIGDSVATIGNNAFYECYALTSVTIPDAVTSIGNNAFYNCDAFKSVTIGNSVTTIGSYAFYGCDGLTSVTIPDSVTSIGNYAFDDSDALTSVTIGNSVTTIGSYAFRNCDALTSVTIGNSVTTIGNYALSDCNALKSITVPDSVTSIGSSAFYYSNNLTSVTIGRSVTSIGTNAFYYCSKLTGVYITDIAAWCGIEFADYYSNPIYYAGKLYLNGELVTDLVIPDTVTSIGNRAFRNCDSITSLTIPSSVTTISSYAFYDCDSLPSVDLLSSVTSIGSNAFTGCDKLTINCFENSHAHTYAVTEAVPYKFLCDHSFTNYVSDNNATCTEDGTKTAYCDKGCGATDTLNDVGSATGHSADTPNVIEPTCDSDGVINILCSGCGLLLSSEFIPANGHDWIDWIVTIEPTATTEGEQFRFCNICRSAETEVIPALGIPVAPDAPVITVDNFTVTISDADNIKDMRFALGLYDTPAAIKAAPGNVALDNGVVRANTVDGYFVYEMPAGGMYTVWIRMLDGNEYFLPLDVTNVVASVSSYGVTVTLHNLDNVKDFYIAKGEYETYREIKDNGYIVSVTAAKIGTKHDYTYTVYEPGIHTVLIRYNDGRTALFHEELTVDEPVFTTNGLQVTISNIPDVKVIRTAYGEYYTPGDTKRADGARNFSNKAVIKDAEEYTVQYRNEGMVTIIVEYNNGYVKVFHYDVKIKQAGYVKSGSTVLFDSLDGMVMIRYAMGNYATSSEIKAAEGSKVFKASQLTGPYAVISGLKPGTYTFCVQFNDESYNYFKIVIE